VGPAPYTGLRIAIATVNGLHTATGIPLVPIDALKAFVRDYRPQNNNQVTVALLNAFNNDLFYAAFRHDGTLHSGYENADTLHERLKKEFNGLNIYWIGNATPQSSQDYPSQKQLAAYAWQEWLKHNTTDLALPLYLKQIKPY
jgi:tRNA threonylcarbamoyl adenosine modification protein YeaZ